MKEPIEKVLYPKVAREFESEHLKVECPKCGEKEFYRFIHAKNQNWMCFNYNCDFCLKSTEGR